MADSELTARWLALLMATEDPDKLADNEIEALLAARGAVERKIEAVGQLFPDWLVVHLAFCQEKQELE